MNRLEPDAALPEGGEPSPLPDYYSDFALWLKTQAELLRERKFELLDIDNLAEEVDSMGRSLHRELKSRLKVVLVHLLKCKFQPVHRSSNWLGTLDEQRRQIAELIKESPSLERHLMEYADAVYHHAARAAALETGLPLADFPVANPFSQTELLDPDFVP